MDFLVPAAAGLLVFVAASVGCAFLLGSILGRSLDAHERAVTDSEFQRLTGGQQG